MFNFLCCHSEDLEAQRQAASSAARSSADDAVFQWVHMPCWVKCNPDGTPVEPLQARLQHPATVLDARPKALGHFFYFHKHTAPQVHSPALLQYHNRNNYIPSQPPTARHSQPNRATVPQSNIRTARLPATQQHQHKVHVHTVQ